MSMRNVFNFRKAVRMESQPIVLSNDEIVMVMLPEKVYTVDQASKALQVPFEEEMKATIDAKLLRERIEEAQALLVQLQFDKEIARKRFSLVEKMVAASGFRPVRPCQEDGILVPYAVEEDLEKGVLIASVNGSKGSNVLIRGQP